MLTFNIALTSSYQNVATLLSASGISNVYNPVAMDEGFFRNNDTTISVYIASGYSAAPSTSIGLLLPGAVLLFNEGFNANQCWVKSASGTPSLTFCVGSQGLIPSVIN